MSEASQASEEVEHADVSGAVSPVNAAAEPAEATADAEPAEATADAAPSAVEVAEAWLAELADTMAVSATDVQDRLLDLWGALQEGPARSEVERWLTETLRRNLYSVSDINDRLETFLPV